MERRPRSLLPPSLALAFLLPGSVAWAGIELGTPIPRAAALHVSTGGLRHLGDAVEKLVPPTFPVEDMAGDYLCSETDAVPLHYELGTLEVRIAVGDVSLVPSKGRLDLSLTGTLGSSASTLLVSGNCAVLSGLDERCAVQIPTTSLGAHVGLTLAIHDGLIDAEVDDFSVTLSPIGNPVDGCMLESAIGTLLGQNEYAINDLILSFLAPELEGVGEEIEAALEDALNGLVLATEIPLGDVTMQLALEPTRLDLGDEGIIVGLGATLAGGEASACVDAAGGSEALGGGWPVFSETVPGGSLPYDVGIVVNRDFTDHLLWALWSRGLLCVELQELQGLPLGTDLLGSFLGSDFAALFPQDQPARVVVDPRAGPPRTGFEHDEPPLRVLVEDLGIEVFSSLDGREIRVFRLDADLMAGLSVTLDAKALTPVLVIDPNAFVFEESANELLPARFSDGLRAMVPKLLGMFLPDDLLGTIALPDLMGLGVAALVWQPSENGQWQGGFLLADTSGVLPLDLGGCSGGSLGCGEEGDTGSGGSGLDLGLGCDDASAGCGGEGCASSCSATRPVGASRLASARLVFALGLLSLLLTRRRP